MTDNFGYPQFTTDDNKFIRYLNELHNDPDYGLLLYKGDPIKFEVDKNDWLREKGKY